MMAATTTSKTAANAAKTVGKAPAAHAGRAPGTSSAKAAAKAPTKADTNAHTNTNTNTKKPAASADAKAPSAVSPSPAASVAKADSMRAAKAKKPKLVRDSFTMPEEEYAVLGKAKKACLARGVAVKKSELLRVGVALVGALDTTGLDRALAALAPIKAGRPKKNR